MEPDGNAAELPIAGMQRPPGVFFKGKHKGALTHAGADNAKEPAWIRRLRGLGKPVLMPFCLDRPAVASGFDRVRIVPLKDPP
ncbi:MAG: hypothetical protein QM581_08635 [Pseudomonas sp.]